jgi:glutaconate CoA-transferase subunit B
VEYTSEELMAAAVAREVRDGETAAVGTLSPIPAAGLLLAHLTHAPRTTPIIINHDDYWPFRRGSKEFYDYAQQGKFDLFFLSGGQIDQAGNLNLIAIGEADHPRVRLPGGAGAAMLYYLAKRVVLFRTDHSRTAFVERVDWITSPGASPPGVVRPGGPWKAITPLVVFRFDRGSKRLVLESLHPGTSLDEVQRRTGFALDCSGPIPTTPEPTPAELRILRTRVREALAKVYPVFARDAFRPG